MEIAMLCPENSVGDFVDNLADIVVLFSSMSPTIVSFFEKGFSETRFTGKIRSLDWSLARPLKVFGNMSSDMT